MRTVSAPFACLAMLLAFAPVRLAGGQTMPPSTPEGVLLSLADRAEVIFTGHVTAIQRSDAGGFVDVRFRIDQAIRGCQAPGFYVLREWAGLWSGRAARYRVGDERLMLLTRRGPSGISAPVDGMDGAVPLIAAEPAPVGGAQGTIAPDSGVEAELHVDLRWLRTRSLRASASDSSGDGSGVHPLDGSPVMERVPGQGVGLPAHAQAAPVATTPIITSPILPDPTGGSTIPYWPGPIAPLPPASTAAGWTPAGEPGLSAIVELLRGSARGSHAAR